MAHPNHCHCSACALVTEHFEYHRFVKAIKIACRLVKYSEHLVPCRHAIHCNVKKKAAQPSHLYEKKQPRVSNYTERHCP